MGALQATLELISTSPTLIDSIDSIILCGLTMHGQTLVDTALKVYFGEKTTKEVYDIYETLATYS